MREQQQPGSAAVKDQMVETVVNILYAYRVNCASATSHGQLILPESLKLLPLYASCVFKQRAFRKSKSTTGSVTTDPTPLLAFSISSCHRHHPSENTNCRIDMRFAQMLQLLAGSVQMTSAFLYPRL